LPCRTGGSQDRKGKSEFVRRAVFETGVAPYDQASPCEVIEPSSNRIAAEMEVFVQLHGGARLSAISPERQQYLELIHGHDVVSNDQPDGRTGRPGKMRVPHDVRPGPQHLWCHSCIRDRQMIPHFAPLAVPLGPVTLHAFGLLVAVAVLAGVEVVRKRAIRKGLDAALAQRMVGWLLVGGFLGAHLVDRLVYFPHQTWDHPDTLLHVWSGLSSFGGFLGALLALWLFLKAHPLRGLTCAYVDVIAYAFPLAWFLGRMGCFVTFDHPGSPTAFFLGQRDAHDVVRHNLGLYEALYTAVIAGVLLRLGRRPQHPGLFVGLLALLYGPVRFGLDFLREVDVRYFGLTPGQYGAVAFVVTGIAIVSASRRAVFGAAH
jgi:phosphatidylglycerol---prolipoprotein diacylglyceryl transferase